MNLNAIFARGKDRRRAEAVNIWREAARLFVFREVADAQGNTHVLWAHLFEEGQILNVRAGQYVEFEALENHEHLLDDLTEEQFHAMIPVVDDLCRALRDVLRVRYPDRSFHVWGLVQKGGTVLVRFYQDWENEEEYWTDDMQTDENEEKMIHYRTEENKHG